MRLPFGACLPAGCIAYGEALDLRAQYLSPDHLGAVAARRPFCCRGLQFLAGWSELGTFGLWTSGGFSTLKLALPEPPTGGLDIHIEAAPASLSPVLPAVGFTVTANGEALARHVLPGQQPRRLVFTVPHRLLAHQRTVLLAFTFDEVRSPAEQGYGEDARPIALCLFTVTIKQLPARQPAQGRP